jgi:hypothetical protein
LWPRILALGNLDQTAALKLIYEEVVFGRSDRSDREQNRVRDGGDGRLVAARRAKVDAPSLTIVDGGLQSN